MPTQPPAPLPPLQVIAIGYQDSQPVVNDAKGLAVYKESGVYAAAGVDFAISEPRFPEEERTEAEPRNLGLLNGAIADAVAGARQEGRVVLMTGGNCSHITGIFGGLQDAHGAGTAIGLVWFDAHGDFNTPQTSITGRLFGMPAPSARG